MEDNSFDFGNDNQLLEEMIRKRHKSNGNLAASMAAKREAEKAAMRNIKSKVGLALVEDGKPDYVPGRISLTETKKPITEAEVPILDFVSAVKKTTEKTNSEGEPVSLNWKPITFDELRALVPPDKAISDLRIMVAGAAQQPGTAFHLLSGDKRGGCFIKAEKGGKLFYAETSQNRQAFTNPGTNSDGDNDADDKGRTITPDTSPQAYAQVVAALTDRVGCLETEIKELKSQALTERANIQQQLEGMDEKSKAVITRLLAVAKEIREGGNFPKSLGLPNNVTPTSTKNVSLTEVLTADVLKELEGLQAAGIIKPNPKTGTRVDIPPHAQLGQGGAPGIGVEKEHAALTYAEKEAAEGRGPKEESIMDQATKMLRKLAEVNQTKEVKTLTNTLTDIIAENLLTDNVNTKLFAEAVNKYNKIVG